MAPKDNVHVAISRRRPGRSYEEYLEQQRQWSVRDKDELIPGGRKLWKEMMIGFSLAIGLGLTILIIGLYFISDAIQSHNAIQILFCVLGIVCGFVIVLSSFVLGKLSISQKWRHHNVSTESETDCQRTAEISSRTTPQRQDHALPVEDPPPPYSLVVREYTYEGCEINGSTSEGMATLNPIRNLPGYSEAVSPVFGTGGIGAPNSVTMLPNYSEAVAPLPPYSNS